MWTDTATRDDDYQRDKRQAGVQRMDDVLKELLAQYSSRFPQFKIMIVGCTDELTAGSH